MRLFEALSLHTQRSTVYCSMLQLFCAQGFEKAPT